MVDLSKVELGDSVVTKAGRIITIRGICKESDRVYINGEIYTPDGKHFGFDNKRDLVKIIAE